MGRNNRDRRRQKQRQKQAKQKKATDQSRKEHLLLDELHTICEPVIFSLVDNEPLLPSDMETWSIFPVSAAIKPFRTLLIGFIDFLFHGDEAKGELALLIPHRQQLTQIGKPWLYPLLYAYCLMSEKNLIQGDINTLADTINNEGIPYNANSINRYAVEELCAPFYLLLWVMGRPIERGGNLGTWLQNWLGGSPLYGLLPSLKKFLALKHPKAEQKTVKILEAALANGELDEHDEWYHGLHLLLSTFLQQRLSAAQRQAERWQQCPQLSSLGGLVEMPSRSCWSQLRFSDADGATLNRLNRLEVTSMAYAERLSLEALKCRLLSQYANTDETYKKDFEQQLEHLIHLMSSSAPADSKAFAERCLEMTCQWLTQEISYDRIPLPSTARLRRLSRLRPDDYRVALLIFLTRGEVTKVKVNSARSTNFQHIDFPLFFRALMNRWKSLAILDNFYWPLTGEAKKTLFTQCCQKLFLSMNKLEAKDFWQRWRLSLFDPSREPFCAIIKGQACEANMLFYTAVAAVDTGFGSDWLQADGLNTLVRTAEQLLIKNPGDFAQERVVDLLTSLTTHQDAACLFQSWQNIINLVNKIKVKDDLETFLQFALETLHQQADTDRAYQEALYDICRSLPALQQHLPSKKQSRSAKKIKKTAKKKRATKQPEPVPPRLDLFGDQS